MAIVYQHIRKDNNQVFYIGIGSSEKRAYCKKSRNNYWHNIVKKYGYEIIISHNDICWEEACSIEKYLIFFYGRFNTNSGPLVNMTDGGEGSLNCHPSEETKKKLSEINKGKKLPKEVIEKILEKKKTMSPEKREIMLKKMSIKRTGHLHPNAKRVIDANTNIVYGTAKDAAKAININYNTLLNMLRGLVKNKTSLVYENNVKN